MANPQPGTYGMIDPVDQPARFTVVPTAYVLPCRGLGSATQVLLQRRCNTGYNDGYWTCGAAGHVEDGESVTAAAVREAREELGISVNPANLLPLCVMHRRSGPNPTGQRVDFFFGYWLDNWAGGRPRLAEPHKADRLEWFTLAALPEPVAPHEWAVLSQLGRGELPLVMEFGFGPAGAVPA